MVKIPSCWLESVLVMWSRKNDRLGESGQRGFIALLVADWVCCRFGTVRMLRLEKTVGVNYLGNVLESGVTWPACRRGVVILLLSEVKTHVVPAFYLKMKDYPLSFLSRKREPHDF